MAVLPTDASSYAGWYEPDSPEMEITHFIERLLGIVRVRFDNSKLFLYFSRRKKSSFRTRRWYAVPADSKGRAARSRAQP